MPKISGAILGRFMPPHNGHRYLIDFASGFVDTLTVFLCSLPDEPIPGTIRHQWMKELFPHVNLVHFTEPIPEAHRDNPESPQIWAAAMAPFLPEKTDFIFASESYGWDLAQALGARFIPVDPSRNQIAVSASLIRKHPLAYWSYIPEVVRPYYVRRILIAGGLESEAIAQHLAEVFGTVFIPEYTNELLTHNELRRARSSQMFALSRQANRLLFYPQTTETEHEHPKKIIPDGLIEPHLILAFTNAIDAQHLSLLEQTASELGLPILEFDEATGVNLEILKHRILAEFHNWGLDSI